jgi:hypothetical protein
MACFPLFLASLSFALVDRMAALSFAGPDFHVVPAELKLKGNFSRAQLVVSARDPHRSVDEQSEDLTCKADYASLNPQVATVTSRGEVLAVADGTTSISVSVAGKTRAIPVHVTAVVAEPKIDFNSFVLPVLTKAGCNAGACHASQFGKGGFKLSVFAFAPDDDYRSIVRDGMGRRVNFLRPDQSLLLQKPTLGTSHEGGKRLREGGIEYQVLRQWIAQGAPPGSAQPARATHLEVTPPRRLGPLGFTQQLRAEVTFSDGSRRDVTALAKYHSMDEGIVQIDEHGFLRTVGRGQGVALVQFEDLAEIATIVVPFAPSADLAGWKDLNFVDHFAAAKFREVGISPSPLCDDATFLRRVYLDALGTLPSVEQARAFLANHDSGKRHKLVDRVLGLTGDPAQDVHNNQYAAYWTLKWSDLIRSSSATIGEQGMWALYNWMKESFRENKPWSEFVRELITARGSTFSNGPANYYRIAHGPQDLAEATAQLFLGVRLSCAKCHHHPYEHLSQSDYYGFAAFFARVGSKRSQEFGVFGGETIVLVQDKGEVYLPRRGKIAPPTPLFDHPVAETADRRQALALWLTSPANHFFARNIANRYFSYLLGHGLVEPVDDMRDTNGATDGPLLDALAADFAASGFNLKHLLQTIMNSRLYQLDSQPTRNNRADLHFYSHYQPKRLGAEVLLDAIDSVTGVPTKFQKVPLGTRAIELPDAQYNNYFLNTFGKPRREGVCECERVTEPNLAQALDTLNGGELAAKISDPRGRLSRLLKANPQQEKILEELYLAALARLPTGEERAACRKLLADSPSPKTFYEDLLWSLLNSKQFLFVH